MNDIWYRNAVIYGIDVGRFADSDGDGLGDLRGLTDRVPYLAELGITCIWLLPCYPSTDRDNGYDVTDYYRVSDRIGTHEDFLEFLHRAGEHGIRVIMDLVLNHTSDGHPWFQAARYDESSRYRDYYVWSHNPPSPGPSQGTIFPGQESTVWTYDEVARAYYYHRFYHFEPSLNMSNPEVREEVLRIMDFWLSFGIAGFRLDAASHMIEQKALQETKIEHPHEILKVFYQFASGRRSDVALLAEVDESPEVLKKFFGEGGQVSMLLNFLLNNFLFLALAREKGEPLARILRELPNPPANGQWANFLRNLDELDLERLSEEERQDVFRAFAPEEDMRIYGRGIRRRLAPMFGGDSRRIKLALSLLFSLPGTPLLVYGDEIGMGDDLSRSGRRAGRAPMQWSDEANAGFSTAPAERLVQPVIAKGNYSFKRVNVAAQRNDPDSLLRWVQGLIRLRRSHAAIGNSPWSIFQTGDEAVFGHNYRAGEGMLLMLHNLAGKPRTAAVELGGGEIGRLHDLLDGTHQPLSDGGASIELEPYGFRWYRLESA